MLYYSILDDALIW